LDHYEDAPNQIPVVLFYKIHVSYRDRKTMQNVSYNKCLAMDATGLVYKVIESQFKPFDPEDKSL
jgi:hypothetical protein